MPCPVHRRGAVRAHGAHDLDANERAGVEVNHALPFIGSRAPKRRVGSPNAASGWQRSPQLEHVADTRHDAAVFDELLASSTSPDWYEHGDWAAACGHFKRTAGLNLPQVLARPLSQLTNADGSHVPHGSTSAGGRSALAECAAAVPRETGGDIARRAHRPVSRARFMLIGAMNLCRSAESINLNRECRSSTMICWAKPRSSIYSGDLGVCALTTIVGHTHGPKQFQPPIQTALPSPLA